MTKEVKAFIKDAKRKQGYKDDRPCDGVNAKGGCACVKCRGVRARLEAAAGLKRRNNRTVTKKFRCREERLQFFTDCEGCGKVEVEFFDPAQPTPVLCPGCSLGAFLTENAEELGETLCELQAQEGLNAGREELIIDLLEELGVKRIEVGYV